MIHRHTESRIGKLMNYRLCIMVLEGNVYQLDSRACSTDYEV
jgi:hypothetical protein